MANLNRYTRALWEKDVMYVFNHFTGDYAVLDTVSTLTDTGTAAVGDEAGGIMTLTPSDGTVADNDEVYLATANELYIFRTNSAIYGRCRLKFAETTATIYNVGFGFQNAVGANSLIDDGGGPKVSGSTLAIYKTDGSGVWKCASACNGVSTVSTSTTAAVGGVWYDLEIECADWDGVNMLVTFKVDAALLKDSNGVVIKHKVPIANATEMQMWVGAKLGAITNNDTVKVDWWYGSTGQAA